MKELDLEFVIVRDMASVFKEYYMIAPSTVIFEPKKNILYYQAQNVKPLHNDNSLFNPATPFDYMKRTYFIPGKIEVIGDVDRCENGEFYVK